MKKTILIFFLSALSFIGLSQEIIFSSEGSISTATTKITGAESISDDPYTVFAHIACDDAKQREIWESDNDLTAKLQINGQEIVASGFNELSWLYSFQKEDGEEYMMLPSINVEIPLAGLMQSVSSIIKATGNILSVEILFGEISLGKGVLSFDVPEFGDAEGDFCGFRGKNYLTGEEQLIAAATEKFKTENASSELVYCWLPVSWVESEDEDGKEMYTSVHIVYKENGIYKVLVYSATKPFKGGTFATNAILERDSYGDLENVHPACVESLMK